MAESVRGRWGCNDNEAIQRRAHSSGEEDEAEACKILGQKDEVDKLRATRDLQDPQLWHYKLASIVQHLRKLISSFHKDHPNKPTVTSLVIDIASPIARPTIRLTVKSSKPLKWKQR